VVGTRSAGRRACTDHEAGTGQFHRCSSGNPVGVVRHHTDIIRWKGLTTRRGCVRHAHPYSGYHPQM
jgi:hypothetical protein